tara:strand:- start:107 stop:487 length:381 start_codon:yes stop_codon:yes gene_type:complete
MRNNPSSEYSRQSFLRGQAMMAEANDRNWRREVLDELDREEREEAKRQAAESVNKQSSYNTPQSNNDEIKQGINIVTPPKKTGGKRTKRSSITKKKIKNKSTYSKGKTKKAKGKTKKAKGKMRKKK